MNTVTKNAPLDSLGLPLGDHWVKFHVEGELISFEVTTVPPTLDAPQVTTEPTADAARAFVEKWSGRGRVLSDAEMAEDARLAALTAKHLH